MAGDLNDMLSGIRMWRGKKRRNHFVHGGGAVVGDDSCERRMPRLQRRAACEQSSRKVQSSWTAEPDYAECASSCGCRNGNDGVIGGKHETWLVVSRWWLVGPRTTNHQPQTIVW